jgi:hypothetical protein
MWHPSLVDQPVRGLCSTAGKICGCKSKRSIDLGEYWIGVKYWQRGKGPIGAEKMDSSSYDVSSAKLEGEGDWTATNP